MKYTSFLHVVFNLSDVKMEVQNNIYNRGFSKWQPLILAKKTNKKHLNVEVILISEFLRITSHQNT